jgi:hypothetical protein
MEGGKLLHSKLTVGKFSALKHRPNKRLLMNKKFRFLIWKNKLYVLVVSTLTRDHPWWALTRPVASSSLVPKLNQIL